MNTCELSDNVWIEPTEEEEKAIRILLAHLINRPEDRNDAFLMLNPEYIDDQLQQRVYRSIIERPVGIGQYELFASELERALRDRGDFQAANYVRDLTVEDGPSSRKAFIQLVLLIRDQAYPRKAYATEMQLLNESLADCRDDEEAAAIEW